MYSVKSHRPVWAEIDMDAISHNYKLIKSKLPETTSVIGVVKADAYGHGAIQVSQELLKLGVEYLAVSNIDEATELRDNGITCPILLFGPVEPQKFGKIIQFNLYPTVHNIEYAKELTESYRYRGVFPKIHIKIDTGMGRLGLSYERSLLDIEQISQMNGVIIDGIYTHFPSSDEDITYSKSQTKKFIQLIEEVKKLGIKVKHFHMANSAGIDNIPESLTTPFDMVRPGLSLYGYSPNSKSGLKNSMALKCKVMDIRKMKKGQTVGYLRTYTIKEDAEYIAVLPLGYADGIPTVYSNRGKVKINDKYYPIAGRICMDYIMVSLGKNPNDVKIGDECSMFGEGKISVEMFGKACHRIPYEVTCSVSKRVPRIFTRKQNERKDVK